MRSATQSPLQNQGFLSPLPLPPTQLLRLLPAVNPVQGLPLAEKSHPAPGHAPFWTLACIQCRGCKGPAPSLQLGITLKVICTAGCPLWSADALWRPHSSPASPSAQSCRLPFATGVDPESAPVNFPHANLRLKGGFQGNSCHDRAVNHWTCTVFLNSQTNPIFINETTEVDLAKNVQLSNSGTTDGETEVQTGKLICPGLS